MPPRKSSTQKSKARGAAEAATEAAAEAASKGMEAGGHQVSSVSDDAIDNVMIGHTEVTQTLEASRQAMVEGVTKLQREIADFVSERIRQDIETQQALLRCRTFDEVRSVQTKFFQNAMDQYSGEANKLMRLGTEIFQRSINRDT